MYEKDKTLLLVASASAQSNNLSVEMGERAAQTIAVVHRGYVNVVPANSTQTGGAHYLPPSAAAASSSFSPSVTQVSWCRLGYELCLVVTSSAGLQVFDCRGLETRFTHPCQDGPSSPTRPRFARGIANPSPNYLAVGNSAGVVRLFRGQDDGEVVFVDRKQWHSAAVTDIASWEHNLAVADEEGTVTLSSVNPQELVHWATLHTTTCCSGVKLWGSLLVCALSSGQLLFFKTDPEGRTKARLAAEVAAHSGPITGLDLAPEQGYFLSTSEDSFVRVWHVEPTDPLSVMLKFSSRLKDCMLVGGRFLTPSGSGFAVSIYDSNLVQCFRM